MRNRVMPSDPGRSAPSRRPAPQPTAERAPARPERRPGNARARISFLALVLLCVLAAAPGGALLKLGDLVGGRGVAIYACFISLLTWMLYRKDKQQAERGGWRTPESTLHALEV